MAEASAETSTSAVREPGGPDIVTSTSDSTEPEEVQLPEILPIRFVISNFCGVDIGMIATLDPITGEQINLGELVADTAMIVNLDWPTEEKTFYVAIYNINGDQVCNSAIKIEKAFENYDPDVQTSITITLSLNDQDEVQFDVNF